MLLPYCVLDSALLVPKRLEDIRVLLKSVDWDRFDVLLTFVLLYPDPRSKSGVTLDLADVPRALP